VATTDSTKQVQGLEISQSDVGRSFGAFEAWSQGVREVRTREGLRRQPSSNHFALGYDAPPSVSDDIPDDTRRA
jgi:hypothetical protein